MTELLLTFAMFVLPVLVVGVAVWRYRLVDRLTTTRLCCRLTAAREALVEHLGPARAALVILLAGTAATVAVCWPLGAVAAALEQPVDLPIFEWTQARFSPDDLWARTNAVVTKMGDPLEMLAASLIAAAVLGLLWWRRGWWVPPVVLAATLGIEWYVQMLLGAVVDRGHPPTGTGTFPSGGSARVVVVYGVIFYLALRTWPMINARSRIIGWTTVGVLAAMEGYSRLYLLKHWATDVPGGWIFGFLLLLAIVASASALLSPGTAVRAGSASHLKHRTTMPTAARPQ